MRRRLIAGSLALIVGASCGGSAPAHGATPEAAPRPTAREAVFRAGAARVPMRVPAGTPLAGYGSLRRRLLVPDVLGRYPHAFWFVPHEGVRDDVAARALVMYAGATRVTWIAVDLVAVDQRLLVRLAERFAASGIRPGTVIVSASHTHSGPGAYLASALFASKLWEHLLRNVVQAGNKLCETCIEMLAPKDTLNCTPVPIPT